MKRTFLTLLLIAFSQLAMSQIAIDTTYNSHVQSVYLTRSDIELERPILRMNSRGETTDNLMLRFDMLGANAENLRYRIRHCDAQWRPDELHASEFISGMEDGSIDGYEFSFTTLDDYVHYYQLIPSTYSTFIASGNYLLEVYPLDEPDSLLFTRRFWVSEEQAAVEASVEKPSSGFGNVYTDQELAVAVTPNKGSYLPNNERYYYVVAQQNRRSDLCRQLPFNTFAGNAMLFTMKAENTFPGGNCFRYFDLSELSSNMYHVQHIEKWGGEVFAFLQPDEDRSRKAYTYVAALNGGMKTNIRNRRQPHIEADYVWVNFSLPMEFPFMNGSVHIVGDLTNWSLGEASRMEWQPKYKAYTKRLLLKQGYYSYQLIFLPVGSHEGNTATLEGDHFAAPNIYTVYVYLSLPNARYDRLVAIKEARVGM